MTLNEHRCLVLRTNTYRALLQMHRTAPACEMGLAERRSV